MGGDEFVCTPVIKLVWEKVLRATGISNEEVLNKIKHFELNVDLSIEMKYSYVHIIGINNDLGLMKICFEPGTHCCVCKKEIGFRGDTVVLRMACEHALHGGCIVRWLKRKRKCSLCGYKDPTVDCFNLLGFLQPFVRLCADIIISC